MAHSRINASLLAAVGLCLALARNAAGAPGDLDPSFGVDSILGSGPFGPGIFVSDRHEARDYGRGLAIQSDGKILLTFGGGLVHRLMGGGLPDTQFGIGGALVLGDVVDVAVDGADNAFAIGTTFGTLDYRYHGYIAMLGGSGPNIIELESGPSHYFRRLAITADGRLVIGGLLPRDGRPRLTIRRYLINGRLDDSFGAKGKARSTRLGSNTGVNAVFLAPDGSIVATGQGWDRRTTPPGEADFAVTRHLADGRVDRSFGTRGGVVTDASVLDVAYDVALQADGKILVAGTAGGWPQEDEFVVIRYLPDGRLDTSFGGDGMVTADFGAEAEAYAVSLQADGKIVAAGEADEAIALARYLADGTLDSTFGTGGLVRTELPSGNHAEALEMVIQPDGRIVIGGLACRDPAPAGQPSCYYALVARYLAD